MPHGIYFGNEMGRRVCGPTELLAGVSQFGLYSSKWFYPPVTSLPF
jgi:hypothetical protein